MFRSVLGLVARLSPIAAALLVSVAVGASTRAPETSPVAVPKSLAYGKAPLVELRSVRFTREHADTSDVGTGALVAQVDSLVLLASNYPVETLDTALTKPVPVAASRADDRKEFEWPRPDRWTALLATLALGAFFFLRRIV